MISLEDIAAAAYAEACTCVLQNNIEERPTPKLTGCTVLFGANACWEELARVKGIPFVRAGLFEQAEGFTGVAAAMSMLKSRILQAEIDKQKQEQSDTRRSLVGSGDRSERIRTYNYPQGRVTDHRIDLTLYKLDEVMEGYIDSIIQPLILEHQADLLATMSDE